MAEEGKKEVEEVNEVKEEVKPEVASEAKEEVKPEEAVEAKEEAKVEETPVEVKEEAKVEETPAEVKEEVKPEEAKQEKEKKPVKVEIPKNCGACKKQINKIRYYRNMKFFCNKKCWKNFLAAEAKKKAKEAEEKAEA